LSHVDDEVVAVRRENRDGQAYRRTRLVERGTENLVNRDPPLRGGPAKHTRGWDGWEHRVDQVQRVCLSRLSHPACVV
jgi:hypothetical protein